MLENLLAFTQPENVVFTHFSADLVLFSTFFPQTIVDNCNFTATQHNRKSTINVIFHKVLHKRIAFDFRQQKKPLKYLLQGISHRQDKFLPFHLYFIQTILSVPELTHVSPVLLKAHYSINYVLTLSDFTAGREILPALKD